MTARPAWATSLGAGEHRVFGFLQVDLAHHSSLPGTDVCVSATRSSLRRQITAITAFYDGYELDWQGDGGAFLFLIDRGNEYDLMVTAALQVVDALGFFNSIPHLNQLGVPLSLRVSCHKGNAIWDPDPGVIFSRPINYFLKSERAIAVEDRVAITEEVYEQLGDKTLRSMFMPEKEHSYMLGGRQYARRIYAARRLCLKGRVVGPEAAGTSMEMLADLLNGTSTLEVILAGGDVFFALVSEALRHLEAQGGRGPDLLRVLLRRSSDASERSARRFQGLAADGKRQVEVHWYDGDFMLRGYAFDRQRALVSYFLRENERLTGRRNGLLDVHAGRTAADDFLLAMFARVFDATTSRPDSMARDARTMPPLIER
jgi:hypothetical protein